MKHDYYFAILLNKKLIKSIIKLFLSGKLIHIVFEDNTIIEY